MTKLSEVSPMQAFVTAFASFLATRASLSEVSPMQAFVTLTLGLTKFFDHSFRSFADAGVCDSNF